MAAKRCETRGDLISTMDISGQWGDRAILVGTRDGSGLDTNNLHLMKMQEFGKWDIQDSRGDKKHKSQIIGDLFLTVERGNVSTSEQSKL